MRVKIDVCGVPATAIDIKGSLTGSHYGCKKRRAVWSLRITEKGILGKGSVSGEKDGRRLKDGLTFFLCPSLEFLA